MRFTASKSALLATCMFPFRTDVTAPEAPSDPAAQIGTVVWARLAAHVEGNDDPGNDETLAPADAERANAILVIGRRFLETSRADIRDPRCEVKYAWSPSKDVARQLPPTEALRDYSAAEGDEVCGSTDLEFISADGVLVVEDYKTGFTPLVQYIPQIRTLALFAARARGVRKVRAVLTKLYEDRPADSITMTLDGFALDAIAEDLRNRLAAANESEPIPGPHCTEMFCPARLVCPVATSAIAELVPADERRHLPVFSHTFVSHDNDALMLVFLRLIEKTADDMKKQIKVRTPKDGVVLADGRVLREGFHSETKWSQEQLIAKARELGAKAGLADEDIDRELEACRYSFTKSEGLKVVKAKLPAKSSAA